jgi:hypothetical protein
MPVTYQIEQEASSHTSLLEATTIVDRSFAKWAAAECATGSSRRPALSFQNLGPTDSGYAPCDGGPCGYPARTAPHVIIFRDQGWPYNDPTNTLALTTVTFGEDSGNIYAADTEINSAPGHVLSTATPPPSGALSLEAIVTHEAGHFIGLAHSQVANAVMYAYYQQDAVSLTADDIAGVCAIYPSKGCSCGMARPGNDCVGCAGALAVCVVVARRRQRSSRPHRRLRGPPGAGLPPRTRGD